MNAATMLHSRTPRIVPFTMRARLKAKLYSVIRSQYDDERTPCKAAQPSHSLSSGLVTSLILAVAESSLNRDFANSLLSAAAAIVAKTLPFVVTVICSPQLAFSRYFSRLALRELIFTVSIEGNSNFCTNSLYMNRRQSLTRQCCECRHALAIARNFVL